MVPAGRAQSGGRRGYMKLTAEKERYSILHFVARKGGSVPLRQVRRRFWRMGSAFNEHLEVLKAEGRIRLLSEPTLARFRLHLVVSAPYKIEKFHSSTC